MSCFDSRGVAEAEKAGSKVRIDGDIVLMTDQESGDHVALTFVNNTTALVVLGPDAATKQGVERIAAGNGGVQASTTFTTALQAINTDDSLWLMLAASSPLIRIANTEMAPHTSIRLGTMYMSLNVTDSLALDAGLQLGSRETVAMLVAQIQKKMDESDRAQQISSRFDQLDVMADGSDLIVSVSMSGDQVLQLVSSIATSGVVTID
jgi:hypothetical protein